MSRRVKQACDHCFSRKIKCDGKHPCSPCRVKEWECRYERFQTQENEGSLVRHTGTEQQHTRSDEASSVQRIIEEYGLDDAVKTAESIIYPE